MPVATLQKLWSGPEKEINIFIHGYGSVRSEEALEELIVNIALARPAGRVYLLYWKSGDPIPFALSPAIRLARAGSRRSPTGVGVSVLTSFVMTQAHFLYYQRRAGILGKTLKRRIAHISHAREYPINLIAHSLGTRVITNALSYSDWSKYKLQDCILLGGATHTYQTDWEKCLGEISGTLYNVWSSGDGILMLTRGRRVGQGPIPVRHKRLVNRAYPSFGHRDYWPNLGYILSRLWKRYKPSNYVDQLING
ncbi:MAG: DUF726 domain-containing protein [Candidatus Dadabacteria bacterium]|nr:MAG: DUF726 domain-containing protein [Candidatus Dadabacteria bacterium]